MGWEIWAIIAVGCIIVECATVDFTFLMLSGGAFAGAVTSAANGTLTIQVAVFSVVAILLLLIVRPWIKEHFNARESTTGSVQAQIGKPAQTLTSVDATSGRVKIGGDEWSARTNGEQIAEGTDVVVLDIDGVQAVVGVVRS